MPHDPLEEETLFYLCGELSKRGIVCIHLLYELMPKGNMQGARFDQQHLPDAFVKKTREIFTGAIIWCGSFNKETAKTALVTGWIDLVALRRLKRVCNVGVGNKPVPVDARAGFSLSQLRVLSKIKKPGNPC